ncbi:MAG TPA: tripartite tricarboxylate transporter permease [Elusimicrobiota bacterium]|nr:tripartite tricarboxylate transporter permease [Elusimicrobiota bacterium]
MIELTVIAYCLLGTVLGGLLCLIPSLHIYNVTGIAILIYLKFRSVIPEYALVPFFMAMMVAFAFLNTIPMTFFSAADESAGASILPSMDMLKNGKGRDASLLAGAGTLLGVLLLLPLTPFFYKVCTYIYAISRLHLHWIIGLILVHYVMSEWPKGAGRGRKPWEKFKNGWSNIFAGLLTFALASIVGLILTTKPLSSPELSFQSIMPIFVGFFAFPSILQTMLSKAKYPLVQYESKYLNAGWGDFGYACLPGVVGGLMTALIPAVTIGIAAISASHMTNHRNLRQTSFEKPIEEGTVVHVHTPEIYFVQERIFLIAGGINKIIYYVGAFLLLFVLTDVTPNGMGRGGMNIMLKPLTTPQPGDYFIMLGTILFSAGISMLMLMWFTKLTVKHFKKLTDNLKSIYAVITVFIIGIVYFMGGGLHDVSGGLTALMVAAVTTCIGSIPVFFNCRRSHCMAVLLVPIAVNMAGYGDTVAKWLGLL